MQVIVCHEKHGDWLWDASTPEAKGNSALAIVKERYEQGYYYYEPGEEPPAWDGMPVDEIKKLKELDEDAYLAVAKKYNRWRSGVKSWRLEKDQWDTIQKAVNENDHQAAWEVLNDRDDHEYEGFSFESVNTADSEGNQID